MTRDEAETLLRGLFDLAVATADPMRIVPERLPARDDARKVVIVGAGKASARMAEAVESHWGPCEGLVITRYGYARPTQGVEIVEAAHPTPDAAGLHATRRMKALLEDLDRDTFVLALISGGASALLVDPAEGVSLAEKQALNAGLLASGMPIDKMNIVRKHVSQIKGGQLAAAAYPAEMLALLISDVPGDDPADIGSGPTVGETSAAADAEALLTAYDVACPAPVQAAIARGSSTLTPTDPRLSATTTEIIAAPAQSLNAAAEMARSAGVQVEILGDALEGEARDIGEAHAGLAIQRQAALTAEDAPLLLLSGGELTVTRRGDGVGGPNAEYALALALALKARDGIYALAGDTDGVDGAADVAGALVFPDTLQRCGGAEKARAAIAANDSHRFFEALGDQLVTGPTLTNVNDFRALLLVPTAGE
ncbi:MAG: glycerate kinase [Neomegalonema sp.]|nr:glycerate kinase [Neomegalonema sp.]